jgi:hypothetical protein
MISFWACPVTKVASTISNPKQTLLQEIASHHNPKEGKG